MLIKNKKFIIPILVFLLFGILLFPKFLDASGKGRTLVIDYQLVVPYYVAEGLTKDRYAKPLVNDFEDNVFKPAEKILNKYMDRTYKAVTIDLWCNGKKTRCSKKDPLYVRLDDHPEYLEHFKTYTLKQGPNKGKKILCPKSIDDAKTFTKKLDSIEPDAVAQDGKINTLLFADLYCMDNPNSNVDDELAWAMIGSVSVNDESGYLVFNLLKNINSEFKGNNIYSVPHLLVHETLHLFGLGHVQEGDGKSVNANTVGNIMISAQTKVKDQRKSEMDLMQACVFLSRIYVDDVHVKFLNGEPGFLYEQTGPIENDGNSCGNGFQGIYWLPGTNISDNPYFVEKCEKNFYTIKNNVPYCVQCVDKKTKKPLTVPEKAKGLKSDSLCNVTWDNPNWKGGCTCSVEGCKIKIKKGKSSEFVCEGNCANENHDCVSGEDTGIPIDCMCAPPCNEATVSTDGCVGYCSTSGDKCAAHPTIQDDKCYCRDCVFDSDYGSFCDTIDNYGCENGGMQDIICERGMTTLYSDPMCICMLNENSGSGKNKGRNGKNSCGDGFTNKSLGEECDPPGSEVVCACEGYGACEGNEFLGVCDQTCSEDCSSLSSPNPYQTYCKDDDDCPSSMECVIYNTPSDPCLVGCGFCKIKPQHMTGGFAYSVNTAQSVYP
jgi:hypothetical protein